MGSIPTITAPRLTPLPEINPAIAGRPGQVVQDAGNTMTQVADFGLQVANLVQKAQLEGQALDAQNKIDADIDNARNQISAWTDYTKADQLKQTTADELKSKYASEYSDKPQLWRHIEPYLGRELNHYNRDVDVRSVSLTKDFNSSALIHSQVGAEGNAANEITIEGKEKVWAEQDAKTDLMVQNGSISAVQGEVAKQQLRTRTIDTEVARASNPMNSPQVMQDELDRLKTYAGKGYVDPEKLEQMQDHLSRSLEVAQNRADRVDVAQKGDGAIAAYRNDPIYKDPETGRFDPGKAAAAVSNDDSLNTKQKKYVREEFEQEDAANKKQQNEDDYKILDKEAPRIFDSKNPLSSTEVKQRALLPATDPNYIPRRVESKLLTEINQNQRELRAESAPERAVMRQENIERSATMAHELLQQPGFITDRSELAPYILKGLSAKDADMVWGLKNASGSKDYADALALMNRSSIYSQTDAGNAKRVSDIETLRKAVDDKHLVGSQITQEAESIIKPKEEAQSKSTVKALLDNLFTGIKNYATDADSGPVPISSTSPVSTPPSASYNDFMAVPDPKGLVQRGNLPIWNRPTVQNEDGSHSTELSISIGTDKGEVLIPTVVNGRFLTPDGKIPPGRVPSDWSKATPAWKALRDAATKHFRDTGENLGTFKTADDADAYADKLHNRGNTPQRPPGVPGNAQWNPQGNGGKGSWQIPSNP